MVSHLNPAEVALMQTSNQWFHAGELNAPVSGDQEAVHAFAGKWHLLLDSAAQSVRAVFQMKDGTLASMKSNQPGCIACTVADPSSKECALVFVSSGFEQMTGYNSSVALGKNCRFLQLSNSALNKALNGKEVQRMRDFCLGKTGAKSLVSLLLNERKTGERFWNLLHMQFVDVTSRPYILGVQTVLELPVPKLLGSRAEAPPPERFVAQLERMLSDARQQLSVHRSEELVEKAKLAMQNIAAFMEHTHDDFEGDNFVPRAAVVDESMASGMDAALKGLLSQKSSLWQIWEMAEYNGEAMACTVADPRIDDCPLVYVSRLFESMTGYSCQFASGRNCRFLQPNDRTRNRTLNGDELCRMRAFCQDVQQGGERFLSLLINEKKAGSSREKGKPFFNLLVMEHVELMKDHSYIVGVQTNLEGQDNFLANIIAGDFVAMERLANLRRSLRSREKMLGELGLTAVLTQSVSDCCGVRSDQSTASQSSMCQHGNKKGHCVQCAWEAMGMGSLPPRDQRMAKKLFSRGLSLEDIADVMEVEVAQISAIVYGARSVPCDESARFPSHMQRVHAVQATNFVPCTGQQRSQYPLPTLLRPQVGEVHRTVKAARALPSWKN
eukprot:TRINITY_DN9491_c0_g1_i1.p1 TRINITY_DN9491_c0_g1~~TRINITY_DN9491_c0_g1_i1.p1  ORF type:complete len:611 (-),score=119.08 TRINITY_DN9491_c0_g1_i1:124-1956(-)